MLRPVSVLRLSRVRSGPVAYVLPRMLLLAISALPMRVTAYEEPPSAMNTASVDITLA